MGGGDLKGAAEQSERLRALAHTQDEKCETLVAALSISRRPLAAWFVVCFALLLIHFATFQTMLLIKFTFAGLGYRWRGEHQHDTDQQQLTHAVR